MSKRENMVKMAEKLMNDRENIRNLGIAAHIDHGKTTLTDILIASAGLISKDLAGKQMLMDSYELEQQRGITINAANISLIHKYKDKEHLINIIDTPGHIDFGGEVIRAMRAVDGVIIVVDAVEGVMPQTETVVRQALRENVKPILFINKVDRMMNELQMTPEKMQEKFVKVIAQVNELIKKSCPEKFKEPWQVKVQNGSVVFGSALKHWGLSAATMTATGISFKDVYEHCKNQTQQVLADKSPLPEAILEAVIKHLPNPLESQKYRIPVIWGGEPESDEGKAMKSCDKASVFSMMVTDVSIDPHAGDIATGRIYSGSIKKGDKVRLIGLKKDTAVQQVGIMMGPERVLVDEVPAGNIATIVGLKEVYAGETIASKDIKEFESFMSEAEPVMTVSVEAKNAKDLPKLIEVLRQITKEDPNIKATINQDTGEHLISGMGELHLEIVQYRIENDHKVPIVVSPPIVVYNESITKESDTVEGKSPNKHNKFVVSVEPLSSEISQKLKEGKVDGKIRPKDKDLVEKMIEAGIDREEAKKVWAVNNGCMVINATRGIQALDEVKELVIQAFFDSTNEGPLAKEKVRNLKVYLEDATLHEDSIHRGPAQVLPAVTRAIWACTMLANPIILEPKQLLSITVQQEYMGSVSKELQARRTQIQEMRTEGDQVIITAKAPVKELIGFSAAIRGATQGRALWTAEYYGYEQLPKELQANVVKQIRQRKGLPPEVRDAAYYMD